MDNLDDITVLITGAGAPGIKGTIYSLEKNFDNRKIKIIGSDIKNDVIGKYFCHHFYQISRPSKEYLNQLTSICEKDEIDVILPQNTMELSILSKSKKEFEDIGTKIAISDNNSIDIANDKYKLMKIARSIDIPTAEFYLADNFEKLVENARKLGWPKMPVVVKPPISNGMRGVRIIDESIDLKNLFYSEKPTGLYIKMEDLKNILGYSFPELIIMEYLPKEEYTIDVLNAETITIIPRKREIIKSGITFNGIVEYNEELIEYSEKLSKKIGLSFAHGFQFKFDENNVPKLLESNPRIQGTMVLSTFAGANIIYGTVKYALKEKIPEFKINWGTKILRYWGGLGINNGINLGTI